jgi:hypothetical protein
MLGVLGALRGECAPPLQQPQHPQAHHRHQPLHLLLRGRGQRQEVHPVVQRHPDAVREERMKVRGQLQGRAEVLGEGDGPRLPPARAEPPRPALLQREERPQEDGEH